MSSKTRFENKEMIETPANWPSWPVLPIKKPKSAGFPDCAIMIDSPGYMTTVFMLNMFDDLSEERIKDSEKIVYDSIDKLLDAGWIVD